VNQKKGKKGRILKVLLPAQPTLLAGTTTESKTVIETLSFMVVIIVPHYTGVIIFPGYMFIITIVIIVIVIVIL